MAEWLRGPAALAEDMSLFPCTHDRQLTTAYNYSSTVGATPWASQGRLLYNPVAAVNER